MIEYRPSSQLGATELPELNARHHFCFAQYQRADRISWGRLRGIHHIRLGPGARPPARYHHDMDILLLPQTGTLDVHSGHGPDQHIGPGQLLLISAGIGIEYAVASRGHAAAEYVEIWIIPEGRGGNPSVTLHALRSGHGAVPIASGRTAGIRRLHADAVVSRVELLAGEHRPVPLRPEDHVYAVALRGRIEAGDAMLEPQDGLAIVGEESLPVTAHGPSELLLVETA